MWLAIFDCTFHAALLGDTMTATNLSMSFGMVIVLAGIVVFFDARLGHNRYMIAIREWQTFIAAVFGFAAVSYSIILQGIISDEREAKAKVDGEIVLLEYTVNDIANLQVQINALIEFGSSIKDSEIDGFRCVSVSQAMNLWPLRNMIVSSRLEAVSTQISPYGYALLAESISVVSDLRNLAGTLSTQQCMTDAKLMIKSQIELYSSARNGLIESKKLMESWLDTLRAKQNAR